MKQARTHCDEFLIDSDLTTIVETEIETKKLLEIWIDNVLTTVDAKIDLTQFEIVENEIEAVKKMSNILGSVLNSTKRRNTVKPKLPVTAETGNIRIHKPQANDDNVVADTVDDVKNAEEKQVENIVNSSSNLNERDHGTDTGDSESTLGTN